MAETDWAIVVGISHYPAKEFEKLDGPERDADDFHQWVLDPKGGAVPARQVKKFVSSAFKPAVKVSSGKPDADRINRFFVDLEDIAKRNEKRGLGLTVGRRLYVFLSGHGFAPSRKEAALLAANSSFSRPMLHVPGTAWADLLHEGLWFEEILLFMDCCRNTLPGAFPNPPGLKVPRRPDRLTKGKRLFAFAAGNGRLARERRFGKETRGVFSKALMAGLRGAASDRLNGKITALSLRNYLINNMQGFLDPADLANPDIPKEPDLQPSTTEAGPDFVIAEVEVKSFPVVLEPPAGSTGLTINVRDGVWRNDGFPILKTQVANGAAWNFALPVGNYFAEIVGGPPLKTFTVTAGGGKTHVRFV
jgi:hypothetical protein